jgi:hypothetical protein
MVGAGTLQPRKEKIMSGKHLSMITVASAFILAFASPQLAAAGGLSDTVSGVSDSLSGGGSHSGSSSQSASSSHSGHSSHGNSGGGINVKVKTNLLGGTQVKADALSKKGVANVKASTGLLDTRAKAGVLNKNGVASAKVSIGSLNTRAHVNVLSNNDLANLGVSIGGGSDKGSHSGGNGKPVVTGGGVLGNLSDAEVAALQVRCVDILKRPARYDAQLVALCSILQQI